MKIRPIFLPGFLCTLCLLLITSWAVSDDNVRVVVLGDSRSSGEDVSGFNNAVLTSLLKQIREVSPAAVFFTGDLVLGLEKEEDEDRDKATSVPAPATDIYENHWAKAGFEYNNAEFKKQLEAFSHDLDKYMGTGIPFHPMIGNHEAVGPDAVEIFRDHFDIDDVAPVDRAHLVYTVTVEHNLFIILATDYYDTAEKRMKEHTMGSQVLDWLEKELTEEGPKYDRIFVMGHEPAFSLMGKKKIVVGLDRNPQARDRFWKMLKDHHVSAYLCAHQHLFSATRQQGVWQIISGGAGAPLDTKIQPDAYFHYLILDIPKDKERPTRITVVDAKGKTIEVSKLKPVKPPVRQKPDSVGGLVDPVGLGF